MIGSWTEESIREFLQTEQLGYQKIQLPFGLSTQGADRKRTCDLIFGENLNGKSVLDIGSYLGYFCLEALSRGAERAVGWEVYAESVRHARAIAQMRGSSAEYYERDIEQVTPQNEKFDVVLCLNVLHHLADPIGTLDKLIQLTRDTLILEVATLGGHDGRKLGIPRMLGHLLDKLPVLFVARGATTPPYDKQDKFYFTRSAMRNLLQYQRAHFAQVSIIDSEFKNRFIVVAQRRRVKHLIVVAGPTSSGKSTLISKMIGDEYPELGEKLNVSDLSSSPVFTVRSFTVPRLSQGGPASEPVLDNAVFHYDFLRPFARSTRTLERDEGLDILSGADEISFVTLWTAPDRLQRQIGDSELAAPEPSNLNQRIKSALRNRMPVGLKFWVSRLPMVGTLVRKLGGRHLTWSPGKRHTRIRELYENSENIVDQYRSWFEFINNHKDKIRNNLVVDCSDGLTIYSRDEWDQIVDQDRDRDQREIPVLAGADLAARNAPDVKPNSER